MLENILKQDTFTKEDVEYLLGLTDEADCAKLYENAYEVKKKYVGNEVYYRGLIEFSNYCIKDCYYCGIRKSITVDRFDNNLEEILEMAKWAHVNNYGSVTLQSGERQDPEFIDFVETVIKEIKKLSNGELGLTLSLGEQTYETYKRWFDAGGHRFLLRIETTNKELYKTLHPNDDLHSFDKRVECLHMLQKIGYQVGTGVMIGLPNQTIGDLANDILFFKNHDIDMIGMGPYVIQRNTPTGKVVLENDQNTQEAILKRYRLSLNMIAVTRLVLEDVNIAATTALQALNPKGREAGLKAGANILMPIITLEKYREKYQLYDDKPCVDDNSDKCKICLLGRVSKVGEKVGYGKWGDSPHFDKRTNSDF